MVGSTSGTALHVFGTTKAVHAEIVVEFLLPHANVQGNDLNVLGKRNIIMFQNCPRGLKHLKTLF